MARYFFDVHGAGAAVWDDDGLECADHDQVEQHTRKLLLEHIDSPDSGAYGQPMVSATVRCTDGKIGLTGTAKSGQPVQVQWTERR